MKLVTFKNNKTDQQGFTLLELLITIVLIGILGMGISMSLITTMKVYESNKVDRAANTLAGSKLEQLLAIKPDLLDDSDDSSETGLSISGTNITFSRTVDITVESNGSRSISVTVESENNSYQKTVVMDVVVPLIE